MMGAREVSVSGRSSAGRTAPGSSGSTGRAARRSAVVRGGAAKRRSAKRRNKPVAAGPGLSRSKRKPASGRRGLSLPASQGSLSVIISARNEEQTLPKLLEQVERLKPQEIIVVLNGCNDRSFQRTRLCAQASIVYIPESAGHDVGRSLGAKLSRGDILLFLDGDMVISAGQLSSLWLRWTGGGCGAQ